jgi:hypothetical protein
MATSVLSVARSAAAAPAPAATFHRRLPPDTLVTDDPQLGPLQGNGGLTLTRMPLATSPVVNAGAPDATSRYDQRGPGYPRLVAGVQDIGAVESPYREADPIFADGFDPSHASVPPHYRRDL